MPTRRQVNFFLACAAAAAVAYAFFAQFGLDLVPCHLCIFQSVTLAAMAAVFLLAAAFSRPGAIGAAFAALVAITGLATVASAGRTPKKSSRRAGCTA